MLDFCHQNFSAPSSSPPHPRYLVLSPQTQSSSLTACLAFHPPPPQSISTPHSFFLLPLSPSPPRPSLRSPASSTQSKDQETSPGTGQRANILALWVTQSQLRLLSSAVPAAKWPQTRPAGGSWLRRRNVDSRALKSEFHMLLVHHKIMPFF